MEAVRMTSSSTHVPDFQDWITYYNKTPQTKSLVTKNQESVVATVDVNSVEKSDTKDVVELVGNSIVAMQDIELVSPVQGAVQQARAELERTEPIKSLNVVKKPHTKNGTLRKRSRGKKQHKKKGYKKKRGKKKKKKKKNKKKKKRKNKVVKRLKSKTHKKKLS
jgi:hypothetical protein